MHHRHLENLETQVANLKKLLNKASDHDTWITMGYSCAGVNSYTLA